MIHLAAARLLTSATSLPNEFPFNVPVIRAFSEMELPSEVTFLVGENGSGKSTLLEALACAVGLPVVGSESAGVDTSLIHARKLAKHLGSRGPGGPITASSCGLKTSSASPGR